MIDADQRMRNNEVTITMTTKHGAGRVFSKDDLGWYQHVESSGKTYRMSAEQVLSHLLPALLGQRIETGNGLVTLVERKQ